MATDIGWCHWFHEPSGKWVKGETLNTTVGCSHAAYTGSDGQKHAHPGCGSYGAGEPRCYAERFCSRGMHDDHASASQKGHWTGNVIFRPDYLARPFTHRSFMPRRDGLKRFVFLTSLSDMGHPALEIEAWKAINGMMLLSPWNVYLDFTKRPEIQRERLERWSPWECVQSAGRMSPELARVAPASNLTVGGSSPRMKEWSDFPHIRRYVSVSDQETADALVPELLRIPAAFRGVSYEPAVGPVDFRRIRFSNGVHVEYLNALTGHHTGTPAAWPKDKPDFGWSRIDHVIVGGTSGASARPFDIEWARETIRQCREASTSCYVKQLGSVAIERDGTRDEWRNDRAPFHAWPLGTVFGNRTGKVEFNGRQVLLEDGSGADPSEWPEDLRVQEQVIL